MADEELFDLTEFAGLLAPDDELYMVDKSDTSDNASGTNFKIKARKLPGKMPLLPTITNATADEFDFDTPPTGFRRWIIEGEVRSDESTDLTEMLIYLNADTTDGNYHHQAVLSGNGVNAAQEGASPDIGKIPGSTAPSGAYAHIRIVIEDPEGANLKCVSGSAHFVRSSTHLRLSFFFVGSSITAGLTRVRLRAVGHPTNQMTGELTLYGEM